MMIRLSLTVWLIGVVMPLSGQKVKDQLTHELQVQYKKSDLPGFGLAIVTKDSILYQGGFGFANRKKRIPYSSKTIQKIGSITKTFLGAAVMKGVELNLFQLETPINELLPFKVIHPEFENIDITIKHLVTHTSGYKDDYWTVLKGLLLQKKLNPNRKGIKPWYTKQVMRFNENEPISLSEFLHNQLSIDGLWYKNEGQFYSSKPGTEYHYSNIASALLGYIIELATNKPYHEFIQTYLLDPLQMSHTSWDYRTEFDKEYAIQYFHTGPAVPRSEWIIYPAGGLMASIEDLSLYLQEMLKGYYGQGKILTEESFNTMFTVQFEGGDRPGVLWDIGKKTINHNGAGTGHYALLSFNPTTGIGKVLMTNTHASWFPELEEQFYAIWKLMFQYESKL